MITVNRFEVQVEFPLNVEQLISQLIADKRFSYLKGQILLVLRNEENVEPQYREATMVEDGDHYRIYALAYGG